MNRRPSNLIRVMPAKGVESRPGDRSPSQALREDDVSQNLNSQNVNKQNVNKQGENGGADGVAVRAARSAGTRWRVVDIVIASVLAVAGGLFLWVIAQSWSAISAPLQGYPPASALLGGLWILPGVLGGLVIRKPGAAVYVELVAAMLEALLGNQWGFSTVWYGLFEGLGAELVLAVFLYRRFGAPVAVLAGAGAGLALGILDNIFWNTELSTVHQSIYLVFAVISGAVIAGLGGWALTRALARAGALTPLASSGTATRV